MKQKQFLMIVFLLLSVPLQASNVGSRPPKEIVQKAEVVGEFEITAVKASQFQCSKRTEYSLASTGDFLKGRLHVNSGLSFDTSSYIQGIKGCPMLILVLPPTATGLEKGKKLIATLNFDKVNQTYTVTGTFDLDKKSEIKKWLRSR